MENREEMHLVKDGNAFYEVDEVCMRNGLNREENEGHEKNTSRQQRNKNSYRNNIK